MEVILAMPSLDRAQELVVSLAMRDITVRVLCSTGSELVGHVARAPVDGVVLVEELPDGAADVHLRQLLAVPGQRPVAVVLAYRAEGREVLRERVRTTYGLAAEIVMAGARPGNEVAQEVAEVLGRLRLMLQEQERDAHERLSRPVAAAVVPGPVRRSGLVAFAGVSGGVGTSTVVANLAGLAALSGLRVLLVDAQLHSGSSLLYHLGARELDSPEAPGVHLLHHDYEAHRGQTGAAALSRVREATLSVTMPRLRHPEIRVLQVPNELQNRTRLDPGQLLWAVQVLLESREYDAALMDCGSGLGDPRMASLLQAASDVFLVSANRGATLNALFKTAPFLGSLELRTSPYLVLREYPDSHYLEKFVHSVTKLTIAGVIPQEPDLEKRESRQYSDAPPLAVTEPESRFGKAIHHLALHLGLVEKNQSTGGERQSRRRSFFGWGRR